MVYTSEHPALALLELRVHLRGIVTPPADMLLVTLECPDDSIQIPDQLPVDWNAQPARSDSAGFGDAFLDDGKNLCLKVPSVVMVQGHNYLLHPSHSQISQVKVIAAEPFVFDPRLFY